MLPNFLIIGAQKAGTTSLNNLLAEHPDVFMPQDKELTYFYDDSFYNKGVKTYESCFHGWNGEKFVGNAPVNLLWLAKTTAQRIYEFNKNIKLIASLRNPIDRAYSAYWYFRRNLWEEALTFEEALKRESAIKKHGSLAQKCNLTYIDHGFYYYQLKLFLNLFDRSQILILLFDKLKQDPKATFNKIFQFFQIDCSGVPDVTKKSNVSCQPRFLTLSKVIYKENMIKSIYKKILPEGARNKLRFSVLRKISDLNHVPFTKPPMSPITREKLGRIFEEPNRKLEDLLQVDLSHWS